MESNQTLVNKFLRFYEKITLPFEPTHIIYGFANSVASSVSTL